MTATVPETATPDWPARLRLLRGYCAKNSLDAFVVSTPHNLTYLCGFRGTAGLLVSTPRGEHLIVDGRYQTAATEILRANRLPGIDVERVERRYDLALGALLGRLKVGRVAFEAEHVTVATLGGWERSAGNVMWQPTERISHMRPRASASSVRRRAYAAPVLARGIFPRRVPEHMAPAACDSG